MAAPSTKRATATRRPTRALTRVRIRNDKSLEGVDRPSALKAADGSAFRFWARGLFGFGQVRAPSSRGGRHRGDDFYSRAPAAADLADIRWPAGVPDAFQARGNSDSSSGLVERAAARRRRRCGGKKVGAARGRCVVEGSSCSAPAPNACATAAPVVLLTTGG